MSEAQIFDRLKSLLVPYATEMSVKTDTETSYYLDETKSAAKPRMFGAVMIKKSYISFHLFPVYVHPHLLDDISPDLRTRMQGKSCFNFKSEDPGLISELKNLVQSAYETLA